MTAPKRKPVAPKPAVRAPSPDLFKEALAAVLVHEGGKANHPKDPGKKTNKGITQAVYDAWRRKNRFAAKDVYEISDDEVEAIYRNQYWLPIHGDDLPRGVGFVVFDGAVNSGVAQSVKWLQRALGVTADGMLGNVTLSAARDANDKAALIAKIIDRREKFLHALATFAVFGRGWMRRIRDVEKTGIAWSRGDKASTAVPDEQEHAAEGADKALVTDAKKSPAKGPGNIAGGAGGGSIGIGGTLQTLQEQLTPLSSAGGWIEKLVVWLLIVGALLAIGGFLYRWWASSRKKELSDALDMVTP